MTLEQLTRSLADSERWLRIGNDVSGRQTRGVIAGRAECLKIMEGKYPTEYEMYVKKLDERLKEPYNYEALLGSIITGA